jgi:hypothetical protein
MRYKWTYVKPTKEGYYWYSTPMPRCEILLVQVYYKRLNLWARTFGDLFDFSLEEYNGMWRKISKPREHKKERA